MYGDSEDGLHLVTNKQIRGNNATTLRISFLVNSILRKWLKSLF